MPKSNKMVSGVIKCLYICQSFLLDGCKIGYHQGTLLSLHKRYQTSLTKKCFFYIFDTESPEEHEKIVHRILSPYNISNEIFRKKDDLIIMYCYMLKMVTGCDRVKCYSREKYGFPRKKAKWQHLKEEIREENELNESIAYIKKTGNMYTPDFMIEDENLENKIEKVTEEMEDLKMEEEIEDKYIDNPFGKWALRVKSK